MKWHCIKFLILLQLYVNQAFPLDIWGDIHIYQAFPQTQNDINNISTVISTEIERHLSLGHGISEDGIFLNLTTVLNSEFKDVDYKNIVSNILKSAVHAQYIVFDVTQLNSVQLEANQNTLYQLQKYFLAQKSSLKFGVVLNYGSEPSTDARILQFISQNPNTSSYLGIQGDWVSFINDITRENQYKILNKNIDFLDLSAIEVNEMNVGVLTRFLESCSNLRGIDLSGILLKNYTSEESIDAKNKNLFLIASTLEKLNKISYFKISSNALDEYAAMILANVIKQFKSLVYANVKYNNFGGSGGNVFLRALAEQKNLTFIDISNNNFNEQNSDDFVDVIKNKASIAYLDASYNYFSSVGSHKIRLAISDILVLESLQVFKLRRNYYVYEHFSDESKISNNFSKLFYIDIGENYFYTQASTRFAKDVTFPVTLKYLFLDSNNMNSLRFAEISASLLNANRMLYLDISNNNIDGGGVNSVIEILTRSQTLSGINLSGNNFTALEMPLISKALSTLPEIKKLSLSQNVITKQSITILAKHFSQNINLNELKLSNVELSDESATILASGIAAQTNIEVLDVSFNNIDKNGLKNLLQSLKNKQKFTTLILAGNKVGCDDVMSQIGIPKFRCL